MSKRLGFVSVLKETLSSCLSSKREEKENNKRKWEPGKPLSRPKHRAKTETRISCAYEIGPVPKKIMNANRPTSKPKSWSSNGRPHSRQSGSGAMRCPASAPGVRIAG